MTAKEQHDAAAELPTRWNLTTIYTSLDAADYRDELTRLDAELADYGAWLDARQIRRLTATPKADAALAELLADAVRRTASLAERVDTLECYVSALVTTNSYDTTAAREMSKVDAAAARWKTLQVRFKGWVGSLGPVLAELLALRPALAEHDYFLRDTARQSAYLMSEALEDLAAELCLDSAVAFGKLQGNVTCQIKVPFERQDVTEPLPITVIQNFRFDADEELRRHAYHAEVTAWKHVETTVAACLNSVKGTAAALARRRGRESVLAMSLEQNRIDRPTLDALWTAIDEALPMFRGYLAAKAKKLGKPRLAWWDLFAPVGESGLRFAWTEARQFLLDKFGTFDAELVDMTRRAFDEHWIDGGPRDGKRVGAYCMPIQRLDESRILANFDGSFEQLGTLAHELGHAFHNHCQRGLPPLLRGSPSTLAETASIFCETLVTNAALVGASPADQTAMLEAQLCGATQVCVDIRSRYLFETAVFEHRRASELSGAEFCALMRDAQSRTYADAVDPETYHPYMWLWKPHYYAYQENFYNFPYAFGHLFALGLYARYEQEGAAFIPHYKQLLRDTAQSDAAPLAARFGIDIRTPEFWRASLAIVARQAARYAAL